MGSPASNNAKKKLPVIVVDSREQRPYSFTSDRVGGVVTTALPAGDYSLQGYETRIAIERKSLADYINTVVHSQDRFARELALLRSYPRAWIVVEASMDDVLQGRFESGVKPQALFAMSAALQVVYGIEVQFAFDRATARAWVEELLVQFWQSQQR